MKYRLLFFFLFTFLMNKAHSIPNFNKISSLLEYKNEILIKNKQKIMDYFYSDFYKSFDLFSFIKSTAKELNNQEAINSVFPNLTISCFFQILNISEAINKKEEWAFQGRVYFFLVKNE